MVSVDGYIAAVRGRFIADGCVVTEETIGSLPVVVGYRARVRLLTSMHIFAVASKTERIDEAGLRGYVDDVVSLALGRKGQWRGMQSGVVVLPILVTEAVDAAATGLVQKAYRLNLNGFAAMAQPAVVDVAAGQVWTFRGTRLWGYAFNSLIRQLYKSYLPDPATELR